MSQLKNDRLLRAIARKPLDRTPIWIMRQAGRYLPEYRQTRARAGSFMTLCKTPELACEVTLQPLARYPLDASIIFSDILTIPDAMGLGLDFIEGKGPVFAKYTQTERDIKALQLPDLAKLSYVYDAIKLVQKNLDHSIPLIGFCGSPFTIAAYMVDGQSKDRFPKLLQMLEKEPQLLHQLLNVLADSVAAHLNAQIDAGVQVVMLFDTWGGLLNAVNYETFSLHYLKKILANLRPNIPTILFTKGGAKFLESIAATKCDAVGVDWEIELSAARKRIGEHVALQGNLHPECLLTSEDNIREQVARVLASYGKGSGHIFNLGHGITPDVPPENVSVLIDAVHTLSKAYHT